MRNLKKFLAAIVVVAIMVTAIVPAFAADPTSITQNISNSDVKAAVARLTAFGIVNGKEDGQYHPELKVTRDEFAKLVVESLGLGSAADAAKGATKFSDVAADRWSSGYINVAVGQGIIKGRPDGSFGPTDNVTYAEAVTMLVRALGYKDSFLTGNWPGNYVAKAAGLKITNKVSFSTDGTADRGSVAIMVDNTLNAHIVAQTEYGDNSTWSDVGQPTLLDSKLNVTKTEDETITATPKTDSDIEADEITVDTAIDSETTLKVVESGIDLDNLLGIKADIYTNDDNEIVYIAPSSDMVKFDQLALDTDGKIKLVNADTSYDNASTVTVYVNNVAKTVAYVTTNIANDFYGKVVFDSTNKIKFLDLYDWTDSALVVKSVDTTNSTITAYQPNTDGDTTTIKLSNADAYSFLMNGSAIALADVKADDVIYKAKVSERGDDNVWRFVVVRNTASGNVDGINDNDSITVAGTDYDFVSDQTAYTFDKDDTITNYTAGDEDKLADVVGENVTMLLDIAGDVRYIRSEVDANSGAQYGVIQNAWANADNYVKIYTTDDKEVSYVYDTDKVYVGDTTTAITDLDSNFTAYDHHLVKYKLNKDGEVSELRVYTAAPTALAANAIDSDAESVTIGGTSYFVSSSTKFFEVDDAAAATREDASVISWDDIKDATTTASAEVEYIKDSDNNLLAVMFTDNYDIVASDAKVAVVTGKYYNGEDWIAKITPFDGTAAEYKLASMTSAYAGNIIQYTLSGGTLSVTNLVNSSEMTNATQTTHPTALTAAVYGNVDAKNGSVITVGAKSVKITSKTAVFKYILKDTGAFSKVEAADISDISKDDKVVITYALATATSAESNEAEVVYVIDDSAVN